VSRYRHRRPERAIAFHARWRRTRADAITADERREGDFLSAYYKRPVYEPCHKVNVLYSFSVDVGETRPYISAPSVPF